MGVRRGTVPPDGLVECQIDESSNAPDYIYPLSEAANGD